MARKNNRLVQLPLFSEPEPESYRERQEVPCLHPDWSPLKLFSLFTYLGHGEKAKQLAREIAWRCESRGYEVAIQHDEELGLVFHTLYTPQWHPIRKPIAEHFNAWGYERGLQVRIATRLRRQGYRPKREVRCRAGRADILTRDAVYEVKPLLRRKVLLEAIRQVRRYRAAIDPNLRAIVVGCACRDEEIDDLLEYARKRGVEVMFWEDERF